MQIGCTFNIEPFVFEPISHRNFFLCSRVASNWFNFSSFIPGFLEKLASSITHFETKERILSIAIEERGEGASCSHAELFLQAMRDNGYTVKPSPNTLSIKDFEKRYDQLLTCFNSEAFSVGVAFGLEIIAEENIMYLLTNTSSSIDEYQKNENSLFFRIHLVNEKDHIEKCFENIRAVQSKDHDSLQAGIQLSLTFWKNFWKEAIHA